MAEWELGIRTVLGGLRPSELTHDDLRKLVAAGVREATELDFKQTLYVAGNGQRQESVNRELASDLASFANERGGVVLLGVADRDGAAAELPGVELADSEVLRMKTSAAALTAPPVRFDVHAIPDEEDAARGFYALVIPPSPLRPHAVRRGDSDLRYARRDGPGKRWLSESEVADLYRGRFARAASQQNALDQALAEGWARVDATGGQTASYAEGQAWLAIGLVPEQGGSMPLTLGEVGRMEQWLAQFANRMPFVGFCGGTMRAGTAVRRITGASRYTDEYRAASDYVELHTDGKGFAATRLGWPRNASEQPLFVDSDLVLYGIAMLRALASHAVTNTGAYGDATVIADLWLRQPTMMASSTKLTSWGEVAGPDSNVTLLGHLLSRHTVSLGELMETNTQTSLGVGKLVLRELFQAFGSPDIRQLRDDGAIRPGFWSSTWREPVADFARQHGVVLTDEAPE